MGAAGAFGLLALAPSGVVRQLIDSAAAATGDGHFLNAHEMADLRALCGRLIPGPPDDPDPGAIEARVPEAIDLLLGAFKVAVPPIHAGGPFSGRHGGGRDDFANFVKLDAHAELGWRIRIEGSQGKPEREFAGPVTGLQQHYRDGLKHLDSKAGGDFSVLPSPAQDVLLQDQSDSDLQNFLGLAFEHCIEFMYGAPEYGGNAGLAGWLFTSWPGDRQPLGFTPQQVSTADSEPRADARGRAADVGMPPIAGDARPSAGDARMGAPDPRILDTLMPLAAGRRAPRDKWWLRRKGLLTR